ncbi:MAG TPA: rod shape-determining protein MreD [Actinomycetota bacterium]|nr:rod shape-determining protein MreD [Actinomycetota bacterium]
MRRGLLWTVVVVAALVLQSTVFAQITLLKAQPDLMYLLTVLVALLEGPTSGAVLGFAGGLAEDFLLTQPKGITALTLTLLGYAVGTVRQYIVSPSALVPVIMVFAGTAIGLMFNGLVKFLLGQLGEGWGYQLQIALLTGLYNAILTPLVFPLVRRLAESSRAKRVFRW